MLMASAGFLGAFALIFLRVPIAIALGLTGCLGFVMLVDWGPAAAMSAMTLRDNLLSYNLVVIPLFVLMGNLIAGTGISDNLFRAAQMTVGRRRGGLALATILSCGAFGAVCGSSVATAATMGRVVMPAMRKSGYSDALSTATVAAGGTLSVLIPPSVILVIYGVITETNIGGLFAAGIIPGLIGLGGYLLAVKWIVWRNPDAAPIPDAIEDKQQRRLILWAVAPVASLFALVMGGIYIGWFTVVEASGIGAMGALGFALWRKSFGWTDLRRVLKETIDTTAMMYAILLGAAVFSEFINLTGVHHSLLELIDASNSSPAGILVTIVLIYLVLGCVLESLSILLLTVPLFFPIVTGLGYDPIWFGIIVVVAIEIGLITPPIGVNLFVIQSVANVSIGTVTRGVVPFIAADIIRLIILVLMPVLVMWLPRLMGLE